MALILALEYVGLAACPLNAMFDAARDLNVRDAVGVRDSEVIILLLAVGGFKAENRVAKSFRYSGEEITRHV